MVVVSAGEYMQNQLRGRHELNFWRQYVFYGVTGYDGIMVLRCSLLGHDYGEIDVEREREERGSEVVVTVQEFEECARCGDRHVISENTEVTSLSAQTAADALPDEYDLESETPPTESPSEPPAETAVDAGDARGDIGGDVDDDAAEFIDADAGSEPAAPTAAGNDPAASAETPESTDELDVPTDENGEPITDDGEILEDEEPLPDRDREHGEWPDSDDVGPPVGAENEPNEWPDDGPVDGAGDERDGDDTADVDVDATDDGILLGEDAGDESESLAAASARSTTASTPTASDSNQTSQSDEPEATGSGIERAGSAPTPGESPTAERDDVPTEFYCPSCAYVAASDRASLRAGDICPECKKGYLGERER
ncbi:hypothetical protein SAMN04487967_1169 [Natronorubrum sediminis]|uniref:Uncharacterized protein n=2 Tax=Natronorubrum sediminis TaxID=640943 RepID=A0A1H6FTK0_9EURY|nr:hypothetical protein SAMN04487967_1169 [Natronorubrum sediminis]